MGLSRTDGGQFALLGGRRCLALVNLAQDPHTVITRSGKTAITDDIWGEIRQS